MSITTRFFTARDGNPPTTQQIEGSKLIQQKTLELAEAIDEFVPGGRNQSLALTHLEDVLMRANRGIFAPSDHK